MIGCSLETKSARVPERRQPARRIIATKHVQRHNVLTFIVISSHVSLSCLEIPAFFQSNILLRTILCFIRHRTAVCELPVRCNSLLYIRQKLCVKRFYLDIGKYDSAGATVLSSIWRSIGLGSQGACIAALSRFFRRHNPYMSISDNKFTKLDTRRHRKLFYFNRLMIFSMFGSPDSIHLTVSWRRNHVICRLA